MKDREPWRELAERIRSQPHTRPWKGLQGPEVVTLLLPLLLQGGSVEPQEAAGEIVVRLKRMTCSDLLRLDGLLRRTHRWAPDLYRWQHARWSSLEGFARLAEPEWLMGLNACVPDGRIRQRALEWLGSQDSRAVGLGFALIRLNDWVAPVREAARLALEFQLHEGGDRLVDCLPLVDHLQQVRREHLGAFREQLLERLNAASLERGLSHPDRQVRRCAFPLALRKLGPAVLERALAQPDAWLQSWAALHADRVGDELLARMLRWPAPGVRFLALQEWRRRRDPAARAADPETAERALLDPGSRVQELARYLFRERDLPAFYRARLQAGSDTLAALLGLKAVGKTEDASLCLPYLTSTRAAVRRLAIRTLCALDLDTHREALLYYLGHARRGTLKELQRALEPQAGRLDPARLWVLLGEENAPAVLRLIRQSSKWEGLGYLLEAAHYHPGPARSELRLWLLAYNQRQIAPAPGQLEAARERLARADLPQELLRGLAAVLVGWSAGQPPVATAPRNPLH